MRHNTLEKALVGAHLVSEGEDALALGGGAGGGGDGLAGTGAGGRGGAVPPLVGHHLARARHLQHQHQQCANFSEIMQHKQCTGWTKKKCALKNENRPWWGIFEKKTMTNKIKKFL